VPRWISLFTPIECLVPLVFAVAAGCTLPTVKVEPDTRSPTRATTQPSEKAMDAMSKDPPAAIKGADAASMPDSIRDAATPQEPSDAGAATDRHAAGASGSAANVGAGMVATATSGSAGSGGMSSAAGQGGSAPVGIAHVEPPAHVFAEWPMPDIERGSGVAPSYTIDAETVTDGVTHLVWQRNVPATYAGCQGRYLADAGMAGDACTWEEATQYCARADVATLLGGSGWRLPTKIELESLLDLTRSNPTIDIDAFPLTPGQSFWTASRFIGLEGFAWGVYFASGLSGRTRVTETCYVRCVRGGDSQ
jgi:hypothetical protein